LEASEFIDWRALVLDGDDYRLMVGFELPDDPRRINFWNLGGGPSV